MAEQIRDMTGEEIDLLADVCHDLARADPGEDPRRIMSERVRRIMRSDTLASFVWEPTSRSYAKPITLNQDEERVRTYVASLQFHEPLTQIMRKRSGANIVEAIFPMSGLSRTSFYQDFLRPDGMFHGINLFVDCEGGHVFDLRLWRRKARPGFEQRDVDLLNTIARHMLPAMRHSLASAGGRTVLTAREREVAQLIARGCTDKDIGQLLRISFSTVRTHVNCCFEKLGCANRTELGARFSSTLSHRL